MAGILRAEMRSGFSIIADLVGLDAAIKQADLVLTGEGSLDGQSAHGKVPVAVGEIAATYGVPAVAVAGAVQKKGVYESLRAVFSIQTAPCSLEEVLDENMAFENIRFVTEQIVSLWNSSK